MSRITTSTRHGKTVIFGYDHALGFFFDKYDDSFGAPSVSFSTFQDGFTPEDLLKQIRKWIPSAERERLEGRIEEIILEGLSEFSYMVEEESNERHNFFIVALFNIGISENLGEGREILPLIYITNNKETINGFLSEYLRMCIGNLEYEAIAKANAILYSEYLAEGLTSENNEHINRLENFLQLCRKITLRSWFIKDNSVNFELGFVQLREPGKRTVVASNFLASIFTNASGKVISTDFDLSELDSLKQAFQDHFIDLLIKSDKPSRITSAIKYLAFARQTHDSGLAKNCGHCASGMG